MNLFEGGILNFAISFASRFLSAMLQYYIIRKLLPHRINNGVLVLISFVYALWFHLISYDFIGTAYHIGMNIFINAFTYFIIVCLYIGKFWRKLIVWWYFDVVKTMCEVMSYVPIMLYQSNRRFSELAWIPSSPEAGMGLKLLFLSVFLSLFSLIGFLSLTVWRKILMDKFHPFYLLFVTLPMGFKYSLSHVFHPGVGDWLLGLLIAFGLDLESSYEALSLFGIFLGLVSSVAALGYIRSYDKRAAIEAELLETKRMMELEQTRYYEIERRSEELAQIRHDFNNYLASAAQLVSSGDYVSAQELVESLSNEINDTKMADNGNYLLSSNSGSNQTRRAGSGGDWKM